jgi:hypothetical protein
MLSHRVTVPLGIAGALVGLVAVAAATAPSGSAPAALSPSYRGPLATASGGAPATMVYPSLVDVHLVRAEAALDRAGAKADQGSPTGAVAEVKTAATQMTAAWLATQYVIKTTPPPPVGNDRAGASGGAPAGPSYASPPDTGVAVLGLQHDIVTTSLGLLGGKATDNALTSSITSVANARADAIRYIHKIAPPAPPGDGRAGASGGAIAATWDSVMPGVLPVLDDEIQALKGTLALHKTLSSATTAAVKAVIAKVKATENAINTYWPPVVGDG